MINVNIKEQNKSYQIIFDRSDICKLKDQIEAEVNNYVVVISEKVKKLYSEKLGFDKSRLFVLKDGEKQKNFKNYKKILDFCAKKKLTREDAIIAIGGGVVGDIAGFAAATYMRGIDFVQVPTTLLACTDSSVGGKTAINTDLGKNSVGAFYQPKKVFINTRFLETLTMRDLKTGLGEVVKYAFIEKSCKCPTDYGLINFLSENYKQILEYDTKTLENLIRICVLLKVSVVEQDEKESNLRRILNFGHTYGHAVEKYTKYKYTHGECVVAGIYFAFELAMKNNLIDKNYMFLMQDVIKKFEFTKIPEIPVNKLIPIMKTDKKSTDEFIRFILPTDYFVVGEFKFNDLLTIS